MRKLILRWHNKLLWFGLFTIVCWAISGITHPLMAWFGPQAVKMYPPPLNADARNVHQVIDIINKHQLKAAHIAKVIPTQQGPMLQLTSSETAPRR